MTNVLEGYVFACSVADVPARGKKAVQLGSMTVLIVACDSGLHAIEDRCPQTGRPIAHGEVLDCVIASPHTGAKYHLATGRYMGGGLSPLQSHWLTVFRLKVLNGKVYVYLPSFVAARPA